jgi:hypothetical protein
MPFLPPTLAIYATKSLYFIQHQLTVNKQTDVNYVPKLRKRALATAVETEFGWRLNENEQIFSNS